MSSSHYFPLIFPLYNPPNIRFCTLLTAATPVLLSFLPRARAISQLACSFRSIIITQQNDNNDAEGLEILSGGEQSEGRFISWSCPHPSIMPV